MATSKKKPSAKAAPPKKAAKKPAAPAKKAASAKKAAPARKISIGSLVEPAKTKVLAPVPPPRKPAAPAKSSIPSVMHALQAVPAARTMKKPLGRKNITFVNKPIPPEGLKKQHKKPNPVTFVRKPVPAAPSKNVQPTKAEIAAALEQARRARSFAYEIAEQMKEAHQKTDAERPAGGIKLSRRPSNRGSGNGEHFPKSDLEQFRKVLISLREVVVGRSGTLKSVALDQIDPHALDDEDGTDAFMRFQALGQVGSQQSVIQKIDQALASIEDGTYGICSHCGQLIRKPRLLQMPFATTCMECQTQLENPYGMR